MGEGKATTSRKDGSKLFFPFPTLSMRSSRQKGILASREGREELLGLIKLAQRTWADCGIDFRWGNCDCAVFARASKILRS